MPYTVGMVRRLDVDVLSVVRGLNAIWTGIRADPAVSCGAVSLPWGSANPRGVVRFGLLPVIIGIGFPVAAA